MWILYPVPLSVLSMPRTMLGKMYSLMYVQMTKMFLKALSAPLRSEVSFEMNVPLP